MISKLRSPGMRLALAGLAGLLVFLGVTYSALSQPWLGLTLRWDKEQAVARVHAGVGPSAHIPVGTVFTSVGAGDTALALTSLDFTEEPDAGLSTFAVYRQFLAQQDALAQAQAAAEVVFVEPSGALHRVSPASWRPISSLPHEFWIQVLVGVFAWLISACVWAFRPREASARYLLLSGFSTLLFAPFAGVYSTRELALSGQLFVWLSDLNFFGGSLYCGAMASVLLHYPRKLAPSRVAQLVVAGFMLWFVAQELGAFESMVVARRTPVFVSFLATFGLSFVQHRITRGDPVARASLSWFLLSWLVGTSLFAAITMVPQLFGADMGALQGYGFSLFLLVYGGLAFGILRFRLFDLGEWWFRTFTWILGAVLLFFIDLVLMMLFSMSEAASLGLALLLCGFVWFPLRAAIWGRLVVARTPELPDLFKRVVRVAFANNSDERTQLWRNLVQELFDPLHVVDLDPPPLEVTLEQDGLRLSIPKVGSTRGFALSYKQRGRRLFSPHDKKTLHQLVSMLRHVDESREAYSKGAREERTRIARDLHDDIGSRLLTGLHQSQLEATKESISQAMVEMRTIIHGLSGQRLSMEEIVAELRHETSLRLEAAGIALEWPLSLELADVQLDYTVYKQYLSVMRELISNVIRHAGATCVRVSIAWQHEQLVSEVADDGHGFAQVEAGQGFGIANMRRRIERLEGTLDYESLERGVRARVTFSPLRLLTVPASSELSVEA